jgi:threonine/homoserine efflux transporter RhtA
MLPISTCLVGMVVLGETLEPLQWLALAMGLAAVVLATRPQRANQS